MKLTTTILRAMEPNSSVMLQLPDRKACNSCRNLVSYVNNTYPVEGYAYAVHRYDGNLVKISLKPRNKVQL